MQKMPFPFNYFNSIVTPKAAFKGRHNLNWLQNIVIFIFLNALMMIPVSLYFSANTNFQLQEIMPNMLHLATDEFAEKLQTQPVEAGKLDTTQPFSLTAEGGVAGVGLSKEAIAAAKNVISFNSEKLIIKDETGYSFEVRYPQNFSLAAITNKNQLKELIKEQWLQQNRPFVALTMMLMTGLIIVFSNVLVMFIAAFFIWLTKKNAFSGIQTYKESFNLVLNASGLGTLAAVLISFYQFDMTIMIGIQSLGLVIMLTAIFAVTHFSDTPLKKSSKLTTHKQGAS